MLETPRKERYYVDMAKKVKRRILKAKISHISLCPRGANQIQTIYKAEDGDHNISLSTLVKGMSEQGELLAVVYAPDMIDSDGDTASAEVIKEAAYDFGANGKGIDVRHNEEVLPVEKAYVAESFIIQKDDPRFVDTKDYDGNVVDVTGGWGVVFKIEDEGLRKEYREGKWGGISMGGLMLARNEEDTPINKLCRKISEILGNKKETKSKTKKSENDMTPEEIKKMVEETVVTVMKKSADDAATAATEAAKKAAEETKLGLGYAAPVCKDAPSPEDLVKHRKNLEIFELSKKVDASDARAVFEFGEKSKEIAKAKDVSSVLNKQQDSVYETFYTTNQVTDVNKAQTSVTNPDASDCANDIMADLEKEEAATKTQAA